jgi:predicted glycoside hydrolase/deacetylase ChbG (UPF0249 family)
MGPSSELLGHPPGARVLIVNADDLGMSRPINLAIIDAVENGIAASCSLMTPCPSAPHAMGLLRRRPWIPFGVHLTLVRDTARHRWGPLAARDTVPSLLDDAGELYTHAEASALLARARLEEVEREFRTQIDAVAGLTPTHLDFHCLADGGREDVFDLTVALAGEYGLAARVWLDPHRERLRRRGVPVVDHPFLDSFALEIDGKRERYARLLRDLPPGLSEWAVHPGPASDDVRGTDHEFLTSPQARAIVEEEGIVLTDYRPLQRLWPA